MTINERIKHVRKDVLHLNQRKFAFDLGMAQTGVSSMEQDGATITDRVIKSICLSYGVNEVWLRTGEGEILEQPETFSLDQYLKENGCTALEMEIVKAYFALDAATRQKVFDHFRSRLETAKERLTAADADQQAELELFGTRPMIQAAARSGGVTEIEEISPDEVTGGGDIP